MRAWAWIFLPPAPVVPPPLLELLLAVELAVLEVLMLELLELPDVPVPLELLELPDVPVLLALLPPLEELALVDAADVVDVPPLELPVLLPTGATEEPQPAARSEMTSQRVRIGAA